jgi:hypothetical protein
VARVERSYFDDVPRLEKMSSPVMMRYSWPLTEPHITLTESLEIAMGYLEGTGQAYPYSETQKRAADAILMAWRVGARHKIRLANVGIAAVLHVNQLKLIEHQSFYPRVS